MDVTINTGPGFVLDVARLPGGVVVEVCDSAASRTAGVPAGPVQEKSEFGRHEGGKLLLSEIEKRLFDVLHGEFDRIHKLRPIRPRKRLRKVKRKLDRRKLARIKMRSKFCAELIDKV